MIFDVTKVTYNTYSCAMSGMSRETMKMDGRDSAECQNWEMKGHNRHFGICEVTRGQKRNSVILFKKQKGRKTWEGKGVLHRKLGSHF